ncbi:MAG: DUF262 domain-containing protein [Caldisericia bacterium]|nr:DUF262 domain-containing protein [Caldisericia bacterium]
MDIEQIEMIDEIGANSENIEKIFNNFYIVPDYQRAFVWTNDHVRQLLDDLKDAFLDENNNIMNASEYFIGSIVVSQIRDSVNKSFEIIDGQQRLTTFFILFCAIRDFLREKGIDIPESLSYLIRINRPNPKKVGVIATYRITLQYEANKDFLENVIAGTDFKNKLEQIESSKLKSNTEINLANAYRTIREFLRKDLGDNQDKVWSFWTTIIEKVKLIKIITPSVDRALNIFETINQRGESLQAIDLLKNLVFRSAEHSDYERIKKTWSEMLDNLKQANEKPMRFLRYYIINRFIDTATEHTPPKEDNLYKWIKMYKKDMEIEKDPIGFAKDIKKVSDTWLKYSRYLSNSEKKDQSLENIGLMSNCKTKQHYLLLLSGIHLQDDQFVKITKYIENLLYFYTITDIQPKYWERKFIKLSKEIKLLNTSEQVDRFINNNIKDYINENIKHYELNFLQLNENNLYRYQLKYILAKIAKYIDDKFSGHSLTMLDYYENLATIEHILPRNKGEWVFDDNSNYEMHKSMLGNLTLLENKFNSAASNNTKDKKAELYNKSKFIITSLLSSEPYIGQDSNKLKISKLFSKSKINNWNTKTIQDRQEALMIVSKKVWGLDI